VARHASVQVLTYRVILCLGLPSDIDLVVDWHGADGGLAAAEDDSRALSACQIASHIATRLHRVLRSHYTLGHRTDQINHIHLSLMGNLAQVRLLALIELAEINDGHSGSSTLHHRR
jgi:hypothetical protein